MGVTKINDMDIYGFINSKDIGEYCRKINHKFNPLEAAYLIWRSKRRTLKERHTAWKELINTTDDMAIPNTQYRSLHEFLNSYMEMENDFLEEFYTADDNSVYFYRVYTSDGKYELYPEENVFKTIDDCFKYIQELKNSINIIECWITKAPLNKQNDIVGLPFRSDFEPLRVINSISKTSLFTTFCTMCPVVPTPFKKGDIVKLYNAEYRKSYYTRNTPTAFVLGAIGYWDIADDEKGLDKSTNYNAILYSYCGLENAIEYTQIPDARRSSNEIEAWGFMKNYLDLEYYHGELEGKERILIGIGNYLKGNITLSFLLNTYSVMTAETNFKDMILPFGLYGFNAKPLKLGGWTNKDIAKFEKIDYDLWQEVERLINEEECDEYIEDETEWDEYAWEEIDEED